MWFVSGFLSLIGRLMLCATFLMLAVAYLIPRFAATAEDMQQRQIPAAKTLLVAAIVILILGSLMIIFGWWTRAGAVLLLFFLGVVSYYYHDFWNAADETLRNQQLLHFMKNFSLAGMLVWLIANGGGAWSIDGYEREDDAEFV